MGINIPVHNWLKIVFLMGKICMKNKTKKNQIKYALKQMKIDLMQFVAVNCLLILMTDCSHTFCMKLTWNDLFLHQPFRHLGKYPNHMKELERHLEVQLHSDSKSNYQHYRQCLHEISENEKQSKIRAKVNNRWILLDIHLTVPKVHILYFP